ncbi:MAG TPA: hypothetical protein VF234_08135 [Limnochordia bacterium]
MARRIRRDGESLSDDVPGGASLVRRERLAKSVEDYVRDTIARLRAIEGIHTIEASRELRGDDEGGWRAQVRFDIVAAATQERAALHTAIGRALAAEAPQGVFIHYRLVAGEV